MTERAYTVKVYTYPDDRPDMVVYRSDNGLAEAVITRDKADRVWPTLVSLFARQKTSEDFALHGEIRLGAGYDDPIEVMPGELALAWIGI